MAKGAILIGIGLIIVGVWGFFRIFSSEAHILFTLYPLFSIGIGIALVVLNKEEDKIEERKDLKARKSKKK